MLDADSLRCWAEVDYDAIAHNVAEVKKLVGDTKIMGIVKADAYGHGDVACAKALKKAGVDFFAVACIAEALRLRQAGIEEPILILGYTPPASFHLLEQENLIQTLVSYDYALKLNEWAKENGIKAKAHVKIDTGMNRTGIMYEHERRDFDELIAVYEMDGLDITGIFSHFPVSDDLSMEAVAFTSRQMELFDEAIKRIREQGYNPGLRHIQNSYGILNYMDKGYDYCRPGLLYMGVTSDDAVETLSSPDFIPILSLKAKVSMVKTIEKGATVSYGRHFTAKEPVKVASITIGYADGLPRECSNQGLEVIIRNQKAPIIGNICMDQCMVDVSDIEDVKEGDIVTIIGRDNGEILSVDRISRMAHTINNETLCRISARVPRIDIQEPSE